MKSVGRQDRVLLAGLTVALMVGFARPIERSLLDLAREAERSSGLALVPALIILVGFFLFNVQARRQESRTQLAAAEADARVAQAHSAEMERLVTFGQALARALDVESIREVMLQHLPKLAGTGDAWVMTRHDDHWTTLIEGPTDRHQDLRGAREAAAAQALGADMRVLSPEPTSVDGQLCIPLTAGGRAVGVLGVPEAAGPFGESRQRILAAAAALLGISLRNAQLFREVRENSLRDGLTGCFNRTHALEVIDTELRRARRSRLPVSLIMFDLDHFKDVNDRHGHLCGDAVLAAVSVRMRDVLRGSDVKCRYGGEEFVVLLPETPIEGAKRVAETLRREIADAPIPWKGDAITVTASFGVTAAFESEIDSQALIGRADAALYRAKDQGRNRVCLSVESAVA